MKKKKGLHDLAKGQSNDKSIQEFTEINKIDVGSDIEDLESAAPRATISHELLEQFERFYEYHPARRLSRNLRSLLLEFLMYDGSAEAEYLRDLVIDLDGLFTLLDAMQEEAEKPVGKL